MANWLQKITSTVASASKDRNLPVLRREQLPGSPGSSVNEPPPLPNASVIYGVAASALFVFGLYFIFSGRWFTGLLICLPAGCFLGFALYFLKR
jgi:hypothetical protein